MVETRLARSHIKHLSGGICCPLPRWEEPAVTIPAPAIEGTDPPVETEVITDLHPLRPAIRDESRERSTKHPEVVKLPPFD